jgi:hypothetical protein
MSYSPYVEIIREKIICYMWENIWNLKFWHSVWKRKLYELCIYRVAFHLTGNEPYIYEYICLNFLS